jgi:hypothetical protein
VFVGVFKDWRCGSSGRVPALQVQSPEFALKKKKKVFEAIHIRNLKGIGALIN